MKSLYAFLIAVLAVAAPVLASQQGSSQPVILHVDMPGTSEDRAFSLEDLQALPATTIETSTIWTQGVQTFTGVSLAALMEHLGVEDGRLAAQAVNDYTVEFPVSEAVPGGPVLAYERNGAPMPLRNKGPLWLVYPYDSDPAYRTEVVYSRSIWQLERIVIQP